MNKYIFIGFAVIVAALVVFIGINTKTPDHPAQGSTPQESMLNSLNFWLQHEGGHQVVIDPTLQKVAETAIQNIQFVGINDLVETQQLIVNDENTKKVEQFIASNGYKPSHIEELWGTGDSPEEVAKNFLLDNPGRGAILERGNVYTRVGIGETMKNGSQVFFVILGTE